MLYVLNIYQLMRREKMKLGKFAAILILVILPFKLHSQGTWAVAVLESGIISNGNLNEFTDPQAALGPKDGAEMKGMCCLGGGYIILDMGYLTPIVDKAGPDVRVYEIGSGGGYNTGTDEPYLVFVRNSRKEPWKSLGGGKGISEFDLATAGIDTAQYIRIIDNTENPKLASATPGADIDAIEVINMPTSLERINSSLLPDDAILVQNFPNPFNPTTRIEYSISKASTVQIEIFNSLGQRIRNLKNENHVPGHYYIEWDGKDEYGTQQATGNYYYQIRTEDFSQAKKMLLIK